MAYRKMAVPKLPSDRPCRRDAKIDANNPEADFIPPRVLRVVAGPSMGPIGQRVGPPGIGTAESLTLY
jgi:hypothetical protein